MGYEKINLTDGWIIYIPHFYTIETANKLFHVFYPTINWQQGEIKLFGKTHLTPRLEAFYAEDNKSYGYSGQRLTTTNLTKDLTQIKQDIEQKFSIALNSVLINLYRNGNDSNGWHADNEPELGENPIIASLSLGARRRFDLKHTTTKEKLSLELETGSLLIMGGSLQHHWKHQIAKTKKIKDPRINLTFRYIY
jgi:alkylated DNA repair dioxygenase AlkB